MSDDKIPAPLRALVLEKIDSIGHLEVLVLLIRHPEQRWDAASVSTRLQSNLVSAEKQLKRLHDIGLVLRQDGDVPTYCYQASDDLTSQALKDLSECYTQFQHRFIDLIYNKPRERVQALVDSFKIGGGDKKDG